LKLNLGSGKMIKPEYLNIDVDIITRKIESKKYSGKYTTDIVGDIRNLPFKNESFEEIICFHVIEHLYYTNGVQMLKDIYSLLKPGGKAIIEAPDILGLYWYWIEGWGGRKEPSVEGLIQGIYGNEPQRIERGHHTMHKWGWTKCICANHMIEIGFEIVHTGIGMSHGMGRRDFRVEGIKR